MPPVADLTGTDCDMSTSDFNPAADNNVVVQ